MYPLRRRFMHTATTTIATTTTAATAAAMMMVNFFLSSSGVGAGALPYAMLTTSASMSLGRSATARRASSAFAKRSVYTKSPLESDVGEPTTVMSDVEMFNSVAIRPTIFIMSPVFLMVSATYTSGAVVVVVATADVVLPFTLRVAFAVVFTGAAVLWPGIVGIAVVVVAVDVVMGVVVVALCVDVVS